MDVQNSVLASHLRRNGEQTAFEMSIRSEVVRTDRTNDTELRSRRFRIRWKALTKLGFRDFLVLRYGGFYIRARAARAPAVNLGRKKSRLDTEKGPGRLEGAISSLNLSVAPVHGLRAPPIGCPEQCVSLTLEKKWGTNCRRNGNTERSRSD